MSCFVIAGPSCSGKDTILRRVLDARPELGKPVTTTTRPPREGEVNGVAYHFLSPEQFAADVAAGKFVEHAQFGQHRYGLTHAALDTVQSQGQTPAVILDVQGVEALQAQRPIQRIFIRASLETLERRLRATRPADQIADRLAIAQTELAVGADYDLIVANEDGTLDENIEAVLAWIDARLPARERATSVAVGDESRRAGRAR